MPHRRHRIALRWAWVVLPLAFGLVATLASSVGVASAPLKTGRAPLRAAFFYPWYPNAWTQNGTYPYSNYVPSAGYYSSSDPTLIRRQIKAMEYGHLDAGIISWWGIGSLEDRIVPDDLRAARGTPFKWSLYYELQGYENPSVREIERDLAYIKRRYASNASYLKIDDRPVIFVYAEPSDGCAMAERWHRANEDEGFYTVLKVFEGFRSCAGDASAWHQYAPAAAESVQSGYSFSISPGFYKFGEPMPILARSLSAWEQDVRAMVTSDAPLQLITTFNEWIEGTAVESAPQWSSSSGYGAYLDVMHREIPAPEPNQS
jgi:hypothetical protein